MSHDLLKLGYPHAVHSDKITTLALFDNCRLIYGSLTRFDGSQMSYLMGKHEKFRKLSFIYTPSRSVYLLTSV